VIGIVRKPLDNPTTRHPFTLFLFLLLILFFFSFCSSHENIKTGPTRAKQPLPGKEEKNKRRKSDIYQTGIASWYGKKFHNRRTANGEIYDMNKLTAAHKKLPFNTIVEVENLDNHKKTIVRINDRGPFVKGRIIDLSYKAAGRIGMTAEGTAPVNLRLVDSRYEKPTAYGEAPENTIPNKRIEEVEDANCYIQAGAFNSEENAKKMVRRLKETLPGVSFGIYNDAGFFKVKTEPVYTKLIAEYHKKNLASYGIEVFIKNKY
jgi:rare lipoprotein A